MRIAGTAGLFHRRAPPPGSRPGAFVVPSNAHPSRVRALLYDAEHLEERVLHGPEELGQAVRAPGVTWIDVEGLGDGAVLHWLRDALEVHPLAVADIANVPQRPKYEDYGERDLIITQRVALRDGEGCHLEQVSIVTGPGWVVTVLERPSELFEPLRERIRTGALIRRMGHEFLAYAVLDVVIDGFFPVLETTGELLDELEEEILAKPSRHVVARLHAARRLLLALHRSMWRQRDALGQMLRDEGSPFGEAVRVYVRDAHDHSLQVLDAIESYREMAVALMEIYLSSLSYRTNEVMKTLTVMASIFIPLTFIVGVYGMNFEHMPELRWRWGYAAVWALIVAVSVGLLGWFWRRGWLARDAVRAEAERDDED